MLAVLAVAVAALVVLVPSSPASAQPTVSVSPANGLNPERDFVTVTGRGFPANVQLFVMQCRSTSGQDHTCNSVGLQKVTTDASGSFTKGGVMVTARFGATDCLTTPCAVKTSAVQGHSGDRSLDRLAMITFRAAPVAPPVTQAPAAPTATVAPTAPPATAPPADVPSTTATPETTTTTAASTTTEAEATTTTTEVEAADEDGAEDADATTTTAVAAGTAATELGDDGGSDDGGSSALPIVAGLLALAAIGGGAAVYLRRRSALAEA